MNKKNIEKVTIYKSPEESSGYLLWRVSTLWRNKIENSLKDLDLTHPQFVVLATTGWLTKDNSKITQIDISKTAGLDPNTTSQILRGLEAKNLILRKRSIDERSKNPVLTKLGFDILSKAMPLVEQADLNFFNKLSQSENAELIKSFQKLIS